MRLLDYTAAVAALALRNLRPSAQYHLLLPITSATASSNRLHRRTTIQCYLTHRLQAVSQGASPVAQLRRKTDQKPSGTVGQGVELCVTELLWSTNL